MKKIIPALFLALLCTAPAHASEESKKQAFYAALSDISRDIATYTFLLNELLTARCGAEPSMAHLQNASERYNLALLSFKNGNSAEARKLLSSIPCEERPKQE